MSVAKEQIAQDRAGKSKRGSVNNANRLAAFAQGKGDAKATWSSAHSEWVWRVVVAITGLGGAVTFGLSRDKGAHSLTLMLDSSRETLWFNGSANLDEKLEGVVTTLDDMT